MNYGSISVKKKELTFTLRRATNKLLLGTHLLTRWKVTISTLQVNDRYSAQFQPRMFEVLIVQGWKITFTWVYSNINFRLERRNYWRPLGPSSKYTFYIELAGKNWCTVWCKLDGFIANTMNFKIWMVLMIHLCYLFKLVFASRILSIEISAKCYTL